VYFLATSNPIKEILMSKPDELIDFYQKLLDSLMLSVDESGYISMNMGSSVNPSTVLTEQGVEKRLVLPIREVLRRSQWDSEIGFHPLSENVYRGESDVLKKLKRQILFRINYSFQQLFIELATIAADLDYHAKLSPTQSNILDLMPKINDKTVDTFNRVFNKASIKEDSPFKLVNVYLKHGGTYRNEQYSRVAVTTFPIYDQANTNERTIFEVKFNSKRDYDAFWGLFGYLLPDFDKPETYSAGSRSLEVPYFDALLHVYLKLAKALNKVTYLFRRHLENPSKIHIDVSWDAYLSKLSEYRGVIPALEGNDGKPSIEEQKHTAQLPPQGMEQHLAQNLYDQVNAPPSPPEQAPTLQIDPNSIPPWETQPQPAAPQPQPQKDESDTLSWTELMRRRQQNPYPQQPPMYPTPPGFAGTAYYPGTQQGVSYGQSYRAQLPPQPPMGYQQPYGQWNQPSYPQQSPQWPQQGYPQQPAQWPQQGYGAPPPVYPYN
jgi:hypothetical protein